MNAPAPRTRLPLYLCTPLGILAALASSVLVLIGVAPPWLLLVGGSALGLAVLLSYRVLPNSVSETILLVATIAGTVAGIVSAIGTAP